MALAAAGLLFEELVERYAPKVRGMARSQATSAVSEDLLYTVGLEALWRCAGSFDPSLKVEFWTYAKHRVGGAMRDATDVETRLWRETASSAYGSVRSLDDDGPGGVEDAEPELGWLVGEEPDPADVAQGEDLRTRLARHVRGLPERWQVALSLYYAEELTFEEVGQILGVSKTGARQMVRHALQVLRERVLADRGMGTEGVSRDAARAGQ